MSNPEYGSGVKRVCRGILEERYHQSKSLESNPENPEKSDSHDYSQVLHRIMFRSTRRLGLVGLGFFGPYQYDSDYNVTVLIEDVESCKTLYSANFRNIPAKKKEIFRVNFEKVYNLDPSRRYYIAFQLIGPETGRLNSESVKMELKEEEENDKKGIETETLFHIFQGGSLQMPEMKYVVLH